MNRNKVTKFTDTSSIYINSSLTGDPFVKNGFIVVPYDGTVFTDLDINPVGPNNKLEEMPVDFGNHESLQILFSDHVINSTFGAFFKADKLSVT